MPHHTSNQFNRQRRGACRQPWPHRRHPGQAGHHRRPSLGIHRGDACRGKVFSLSFLSFAAAAAGQRRENDRFFFPRRLDLLLLSPSFSLSFFDTEKTNQVRARIKYLQELQSTHDALEDDYKRELEALDAKYTKKYAPLFATRAKVVRGEEEAPAELVEALKAEIAEAEKEEGFAGGAGVAAANAAGASEPVPKGIPQFWLGVLRAHDVVASRITEKDEAVLEHLVDIRCEELGVGGDGEGGGGDDAAAAATKNDGEDDEDEEDREYGFRLSFVFEMPNPFFDSPADGVVTKTYHMAAEDEEGMLERAVGTRIAWKAGKDPTVKILKKKPKPGRGGAKPSSGKPMTKIEKTESFFNFFSPPAVPEEGDEDLDEEEVEALQEALEEDYELGETFRDELIPHAVSFYTGEMAEMEEEDEDEDDDDDYEEDDGDDDDDEDDDDDDEEDDDDDDEEEEDRRAPSRGKQARGGKGKGKGGGGGSGGGGGGGAKGGAPQDTGEKPAECKQQ